ncbi:MAG: alpha/beta fold hydrolase [Proteobacteria bacterium]|nr:alpha/beta fold hydrolase [Pseudomonadota bacterium]
MRFDRTYSILLVVCALAACSKDPDPRFEAANDFPAPNAKAGLTLGSCESDVEGETYPAECGVLLVPENRSKPDSRLIPLPVLRIPSSGSNPGEPVFRLGGGPGVSNIFDSARAALLANHDYVRVGYRGADGATRLDCQGVGAAITKPRRIFEPEAKIQFEDALYSCLKGYEARGFDLDGYTILEVVRDLESARRELGYDRVNLHSGSYGTRLALLYAHLYPESINRSVLSGANPPGCMNWKPEIVDLKIGQYAKLCAQDSYCSSRTDDLSETIRTALRDMPDTWLGVPIDRDRVRVGLFNLLYQTDMAAMGFDALFSATEGDFAGVAALSLAYNFLFKDALIWGDSAMKSGTADNRPQYAIADFNPPGSIMGTPMSELGEAAYRALKRLKVQMIPENLQGPQTSDVPTLILSSDLDIATPLENSENEILPHLPNGTHVVLRHGGHQDLIPGERAFYTHFLATGEVDLSLLKERPINFKPSMSVVLMVKVGLGTMVGIGLLLAFLLQRLARRWSKK